MKLRENEKTWNFDNWADRYDETVATDSQLYARYDEVLDMVVEMANISPGISVLDIGTGTGNLALRSLARGARIVGLDPSERMLTKAREKIGDDPRAKFCQVDKPFLHIPYPDAFFDAVISTYAFHHTPHRLKPDSVREMFRVLKKGVRSGHWTFSVTKPSPRDYESTASYGPKLAHGFVEWCYSPKFRMVSGISYGLVIRSAIIRPSGVSIRCA